MKRDKTSILTAATCLLAIGLLNIAQAEEEAVNITPSLSEVDVLHDGKPLAIKRTQKDDGRIPGPYKKTAHRCPPFCIQPMQVAVGVETIGELEMLGYLKRIAEGDHSVLVIDSRTRDWVTRGTIPGSVNIPWNTINLDFAEGFDLSAASEQIDNIFEARFGTKRTKSGWDYSDAKTLVLFCNGAWCPQSPTNIKTLLARGYPADKLKWYAAACKTGSDSGLRLRNTSASMKRKTLILFTVALAGASAVGNLNAAGDAEYVGSWSRRTAMEEAG